MTDNTETSQNSDQDLEKAIHDRLFKPTFSVEALTVPYCKRVQHKCWVCDQMTTLEYLNYRINTRYINNQLTNIIDGKDPKDPASYADIIEICDKCIMKAGGFGVIQYHGRIF